MELRQVEHFIAVAEERSFTRAAQRSHIVQSGLSASIRALERELGADLFIRGTRRVRLTAEGEAFLVEARRVQGAVRAGVDAVASVRGLLRGTLRLGVSKVLPPPYNLVSSIARFHADNPAIRLHLRQDASLPLFDALSNGTLDLVIAGSTSRRWPGVQTRVLYRSPLVLLCARRHRCASLASVRLEELANEVFVDLSQDWTTRDVVDRLFLRAGLERDVSFEVNDPSCLVSLIEQGLGIAVVPRMLHREKRRVCVVPIEPAPPMWELVGAYVGPQPPNPAARVFLEMIESATRRAADGRAEAPAKQRKRAGVI
jgi:Transcriptional regulator